MAFPAIIGSLILPRIFDIAERAVRESIADPAAPVNSPAPNVAATQIAEQVVKEVRKIPEVQHVTNSEPWYQKRSRWSAIVSGVAVVAAPLLAKYGLDVDPAKQELIVTSLTTVGGLVAGYLAYRAGTATKPLGA